MKPQKIFLFFFISTFLFNCTAKRIITEYKDKIVRDTIIKTKTITEVERYTDTLTIKNPCDSLGNLKPFKQSIKIKQGNINLTGINNVISAEIDLNGYKKILEETYKTKYEKEVLEYKENNIRYKTPMSIIIFLVISVLLNILLIRFR
jgi:hypothetical protein